MLIGECFEHLARAADHSSKIDFWRDCTSLGLAMEWISNPEIWIGLFTLTVLEIVLGIDNIVFISILAGKLPHAQQAKARQTGLGLALITRVLLLCSLVRLFNRFRLFVRWFRRVPSKMDLTEQNQRLQLENEQLWMVINDNCPSATKLLSLKAALRDAKSQGESACGLVASMHCAAVGSVRGPIRGVIEDVEDLAEEAARLRTIIETTAEKLRQCKLTTYADKLLKELNKEI